jgi:hypothetical protein
MVRPTLFPALAPLLTLALLSGCLGYRSHIDPNAARFEREPIAAASPSKRLLLTLSFRHANVAEEQQQSQASEFRDSAIRWFSESGHFSAVGVDIADPDLELVLNVEEKENYNKAATIISAMTLTVIPVTDRVDLSAKGEVFSSTGEKLADVVVHQSLQSWIGLLLFPATPSLFIAIDRFNEDVFRSILVQMKDKDAI